MNLTANEWRIISLIDGKRRLQEVVEDSGQDEFSVYRIINSLISSGLVEASGGSATAISAGDKSEGPAIVQIYHGIMQVLLKLAERMSGREPTVSWRKRKLTCRPSTPNCCVSSIAGAT